MQLMMSTSYREEGGGVGNDNPTTMESRNVELEPQESINPAEERTAGIGSHIAMNNDANNANNATATTAASNSNVKSEPASSSEERTAGIDRVDNNEDDNQSTSSSSEIEVYVPSSLEYLQSRKRIPFLKRNLVSIQQRLLGLAMSTSPEEGNSSIPFIDQNSSAAGRSHRRRSRQLLPPFTTYVSLQKKKESKSESETKSPSVSSTPQSKRTRSKAVSSPSTPLSKRTKIKAAASPQGTAIAPWMHQQIRSDAEIKKRNEDDRCRIMCFTKVLCTRDRSDIDFVEDSLLVALQHQQQESFSCPFCSLHLPVS